MSAVRQLRDDFDSGTSDVDLQLLDIVKERSFRKGSYKLSSGAVSDHYFDLKATMMSPRGARLAAEAFLNRVRAAGVDLFGGLEMGAVPILGAAAAVADLQQMKIQTFFVRKAAKGHGTQKTIEGLSDEETLNNKRVWVVDDVATKGGSLMQAVQAVRRAGAEVDTALVLLDREEGAEAYLNERGIRLVAVLRASQFV